MSGENLKKTCLEMKALALDGGRWVRDNGELVGNAEIMLKKLRRSGRALGNYAEAAGRKMGVAVFGPSQAGKSTLIASLCKGPSGFLNASFSGQTLDFLREVNPEGGNETTGLVTRFSLDPAPQSPDPSAYPVCLRLFSEMDIVKILANTYFAEAEGDSLLSEEDITARLEELERRPEGPGRLSLDDLEDLSEYVRDLAAKSAYGQLLEKVFWDRALSLGQRLGLDDRADLLACLWGGLAPFTEVYKKLYQCLEKLNFTETAFCELSGLYDRQAADRGRKKSILYVDQLNGLLGQAGDEEASPPVAVIGPDGTRASLPRPLLSALIAELHVQVQEKPGPFMEAADILDFPGYRAREKFKDIVQDIQKPGNLKTCFLRGKVAYLFERYSRRKEITAMLLCIGNSVQNNPDLPHVIRPWLESAHGRDEKERAGKPVTLFLVLTMFDGTIEQGAGATDTVTRWENRLKASFLHFFGLHDWPRKWAAEGGGRVRPFNNIFWLQDLAYAGGFLKVEVSGGQDGRKSRRSLGVKPERAEWAGEVLEGYLKCGLVREYIREPQAAWDAVMKDDDGGVGYLVRHLGPVLTGDLKANQLSELARQEADKIDQLLRVFYFGADKDEERRKKESQAVDIVVALNNLVVPKGCFGLLLDSLQLSDADCQAVYDAPLAEEEPPPAVETEKPKSLLGLFSQSSAAKPGAAGGAGAFRNDEARRFRRRLEKAWQERLDQVPSEARLAAYFGLPREVFQGLVGELSLGARRLKVFDRIEERLRRAISFSDEKTEATVWMLSRLAAAELGAFIDWLGLSPVELDQAGRTVTIEGQKLTLFEPPQPPDRFPDLPDEQGDYDQPYFRDWSAALMRLMIHNVDFADQPYDQEENARLGGILNRLEPLKGHLI